MPSGVYVDVLIAEADDIVSPVDPGDDGKVLARNSSTGKYEHVTMTGGGGTSDHAALTNLDYANAGHTDFAGTKVLNAFTRQQSIAPSIADAALGSELLTDGAFPDLTNWNDDSSGWNVVSGGITHTPGVGGSLTQDVTFADGVAGLVTTVSGMTTGWADVYNGSFSIENYFEGNGTLTSINYLYAGADTIHIDVSADFNGRIDIVSLKQSSDGYPASIRFFDLAGSLANEIRTAKGGLFWGLNAGKNSRESSNVGIGNYALDSLINGAGNLAFGTSAGQGAECNSGLFLGTNAGVSETADNQLHVGILGDIISGTMAGGTAASQLLKFHAARINVADIPTSSAGLSTGDIWNDGGTLKVA